MIGDICTIDIKDEIEFNLISIKPIREDDQYGGFRINMIVNLPPMKIPFKIDVTTGDIITPKEIEYTYKSIFEERYIPMLAYNITTILAEKIESIISRGTANTRMRDFYDVYILWTLYRGGCNIGLLNTAIQNTAQKRGSLNRIVDFEETLELLATDIHIKNLWGEYSNRYPYAKGIELENILEILQEIFTKINESVK